MLSVTTTEDFAAWFQSLGDRDAEDVATGIALIESLGPERFPPTSSDLLLWYQASAEAIGQFSRDSLTHARRARRYLEHLSSAHVMKGVADLSVERAEQLDTGIALIAHVAKRWRRGAGAASERDALELQAAYRTALEALGIREPTPQTPPQSLRELTFSERKPALRVLYGIDAKHSRALLISGEALDQRAYGPSVRRALAVWKDFLANEAQRLELAAGSSQ